MLEKLTPLSSSSLDIEGQELPSLSLSAMLEPCLSSWLAQGEGRREPSRAYAFPPCLATGFCLLRGAGR